MLRIAVFLALLALAACKKQEAPQSDRPSPIGATERKRGEDACATYLEKVCACAKVKTDKPDLAKRCDLDKALIDALNLALGVDDNPTATAADVWRAQDQARKIMASCVQSVNELAGLGCP